MEQIGSLRALIGEDIAYRESAGFMSDREFWLDALNDCSEPPLLSARAAPMSEQVLHRTVDIDPPTMMRLREFARRADLTLPQVFTLATVTLIHRLTEVEDLVIGQFMTARMTPIARATPAMATNLAPLRFNIRSDMPVGAVAEQVRRRTRAALKRQRYRIADIRRDLRRVDRPIARQICSVRPFQHSVQFAGARTTNHPLRKGLSRTSTFTSFTMTPGRARAVWSWTPMRRSTMRNIWSAYSAGSCSFCPF